MIKIAIVEDDKHMSDDLQKNILLYFNEKGKNSSVLTFSSAESFLSSNMSQYDLILMDVQLPGMNGIDALKKFREIAPHTLVIIVTSVAQYAINGYSVRAFDFILKPVTYYDLVLKLNRAIPLIENKADNKIVVANKTQTNVIKVSDIYYVEIYGHTVVYHTSNGTITSTGTMKKVQELLKEYSFALCNQCYFVNLSYVTSVQGYTVTVAGNELAISRQRRSEFMGALNEFFANN